VPDDADLERRFGGLRRLYGDAGYAALRGARIGVAGLGGVGSWTAEALARCGVSQLVLVDLDHVAESNINRQVQATSATLGAHKGTALAERIASIHPGCDVRVVDAFVEPATWPALWPHPLHAWVDACDDLKAKVAMAAHALAGGPGAAPLVVCGAAGGKRRPEAIERGDLAEATHDPLLAALRQRLRRDHGARRTGRIGLACVFSREAVHRPAGDDCAVDGSLNCAGYGSSVMVTASLGLAAAAAAVQAVLDATPAGGRDAADAAILAGSVDTG
jgi:tRNA threonylcarbamoyladenosine dehydratase